MLRMRSLAAAGALATVMACALAAPAAATDPASVWNQDYRKQHVCVKVKTSLTSDPFTRWADYNKVGDNYRVPRNPSWDPDPDEFTCQGLPGHVRLDRSEMVTVTTHPDQPRLYFHKGGQGYNPVQVPYGHFWIGDIQTGTAPSAKFTGAELDAYGAEPRDANGRGAGRACAKSTNPATAASYEIGAGEIDGEPAILPHDWTYKPGKTSSRYDKYIDAGREQGYNGANYTGGQHYQYLTWSWVGQEDWDTGAYIGAEGGGAVRTILPRHEIVERCDIASITAKAWDGPSATHEAGRVTAIYVRSKMGGNWFYGWILHSWNWRRPDGTYGPRHYAVKGV